MNPDFADRSDDEIAREVFKPITDLIAQEDEELTKLDELIGEAERKSKPILNPEP